MTNSELEKIRKDNSAVSYKFKGALITILIKLDANEWNGTDVRTFIDRIINKNDTHDDALDYTNDSRRVAEQVRQVQLREERLAKLYKAVPDMKPEKYDGVPADTQ